MQNINLRILLSLELDFQEVASIVKDAKELAINNYLAIKNLDNSFIQISDLKSLLTVEFNKFKQSQWEPNHR